MLYEIPVPPLVIAEPTSDAGRELVRKHEKALEATRVLHACNQAQRDSHLAVGVAQGALTAELDRSAVAGVQNTEAEIALVRKIEDCKIAADPALHARRIASALKGQNEAVWAVRSHAERHVAALLDEIRPDAERVHADLTEAREKLAPFVAAYAEVVARVSVLTEAVHRGRTMPPHHVGMPGHAQPLAPVSSGERWQLPDDSSVPMPPQETIEEHDRRVNPERYPAPVVVEDEPVEVAA